MTLPAGPDAHPLLVFNRQALDQALALVAAHVGPGRPRYDGPVGAHLRHAIEHYEALVFPCRSGCVDYDARLRDAALQASPALAERRLLALRQRLGTWGAHALGSPVQVNGQCGQAGEFRFSVSSSIGRELAFLASHLVHHFALLKPHCQAQGIPVDDDFGKAPATVAHERRGAAADPPAFTDLFAKENACPASQHFA